MSVFVGGGEQAQEPSTSCSPACTKLNPTYWAFKASTLKLSQEGHFLSRFVPDEKHFIRCNTPDTLCANHPPVTVSSSQNTFNMRPGNLSSDYRGISEEILIDFNRQDKQVHRSESEESALKSCTSDQISSLWLSAQCQ